MLVLASAAALFLLFALHYFARELDPRFHPRSERSFLALVHYLAGDYAKAARLYRADLAVRYLRSGAPEWWVAFLAGDLARADQLVRQELERTPNDPEIQLSLAEIALAAGRLPQALELAGKALEGRRDDYDALFVTALAHARRGAPGDAIAAMNRALRYNQTESRPTVFLATLELTGDLHGDQAASPCLLAHLHRYLRIFDPSHARIAERYARTAIARGDHADAAYVTLATIFVKTGRRRAALEAFRSAAALNPRNVHALRGAARHHAERGEIAEEYRFLKQAAEAAPDDRVVVNGYHGFLTGKLGDYPQALALDRAGIARDPTDSEAWWRLGTVHSYLGDHDAALLAHRRAAGLAPTNLTYRDSIAQELVLLDRLDEAQTTYEQSIKAQPGRALSRAGLATIHAKRERWNEARREYEIAYALGGADVEMLVNLCQVYQALLDNKRAFACLSTVLTRDPDNVRARVLLEHAGAALRAQR